MCSLNMTLDIAVEMICKSGHLISSVEDGFFRRLVYPFLEALTVNNKQTK